MDNNAFLKSVAVKLGVRQNEIILKAAEYLRLVACKCNLVISATYQNVICLDIASEELGIEFDKAKACEIYQITKIKYKRALLMIKKALDVEKPKTIHEISIQLGCEPASKLATKLLKQYKENDTIDRDFNHPMYTVAAVYTVCKLQKISVKKQHCISLSTLQAQQWNKLEVEFMKFAEKHEFAKSDGKKGPKKRGNEFLSMLEEKSRGYDNELVVKINKEEASSIESYECWKKRILVEAYAKIKTQ